LYCLYFSGQGKLSPGARLSFKTTTELVIIN